LLGAGIGAEIRQLLNYTIVGGLRVSQLLTLFTTPVAHTYMDRVSHLRAGTAEPRIPFPRVRGRMTQSKPETVYARARGDA
jgi:hypothetical protein